MIKGKGKFSKVAGHAAYPELLDAINKLPDGEDYLFVICDSTKNRNLPFLSYYFSVVLSFISDSLPSHPSTTALYKYFEVMFAPVHNVEISGERFTYHDLKTEKARDVNDVIEKVVDYALNHWGIDIPRREETKSPEMREMYSQAYLNQEVDWSNYISSRKLLSKDERRNKKDERI